MDVLNDYYPLYPENPDTAGLSESELSENQEHIETLERLNGGRKRKKPLHFDDFCLVDFISIILTITPAKHEIKVSMKKMYLKTLATGCTEKT